MKDMTKVSLFKYLTPQEVDWMLVKWKKKNISESTIIIKEETIGDEILLNPGA